LANNPSATEIEIRLAGAKLETEIARQAAQIGVTSLLLVLPSNMPSIEGEEFIRILRRKITPEITQILASDVTSSQPSQYLT
jgi:hypothetical protein